MNLARRNEYLKALGIEVWVARQASVAPRDSLDKTSTVQESQAPRPIIAPTEASDTALRIVIGPGEGNTLFLCGKSADAATPLAADIARSLDCEPVWSWPQQDESAPGLSLQQAIEERLFTRVLVFGPDLVASPREHLSMVIGSARLICSEAIPVLSQSGAARRALWLDLCASQWCAQW